MMIMGIWGRAFGQRILVAMRLERLLAAVARLQPSVAGYLVIDIQAVAAVRVGRLRVCGVNGHERRRDWIGRGVKSDEGAIDARSTAAQRIQWKARETG